LLTSRPRRLLRAVAVAAALLAVPAAATSSAALAATAPVRTDVVAVTGTDGQLWVRDTAGMPWTPFGGRLVDAPTFVWGYYDDYFIGQGADGNVWIRTWEDDWRPLGPRGTRCAGSSAVVSWKTLAVVCIGGDGALWVGKVSEKQDVVPRISGWSRLGGDLQHGVSVMDVGTEDGEVSFVYVGIGGDDRPWWRSDTTGWLQLSTARCAAPMAASAYGDALACRGTAYDGRLRTFHYVSGRENVYASSGSVLGRPGVAVDPDGVTRYYFIGADGTLYRVTQRADGTLRDPIRFGGKGIGGVSVFSTTGLTGD
jgi:hypothetical protein